MAIVIREIEVKDDEILEVEFEGDTNRTNNSYSDYYGIVESGDFYYVENIYWSTEAYSPEENKIIDEYLTKNFDSIERELIQKDKEEYSF